MWIRITGLKNTDPAQSEAKECSFAQALISVGFALRHAPVPWSGLSKKVFLSPAYCCCRGSPLRKLHLPVCFVFHYSQNSPEILPFLLHASPCSGAERSHWLSLLKPMRVPGSSERLTHPPTSSWGVIYFRFSCMMVEGSGQCLISHNERALEPRCALRA